MLLLELFWSFIQIGLFSIGGGYAAMPLIQEQIVTKHSWLTLSEFADVVTIAEMTPGPIALNAASFVGTQLAGLPGALLATAGCMLPSCIIVSVFAVLYRKYSKLRLIDSLLSGLRPAVVGLVAAAAFTIVRLAVFSESAANIGPVNVAAICIFALGFFALRKFKCSPIIVLLAAGAVGGVVYSII